LHLNGVIETYMEEFTYRRFGTMCGHTVELSKDGIRRFLGEKGQADHEVLNATRILYLDPSEEEMTVPDSNDATDSQFSLLHCAVHVYVTQMLALSFQATEDYEERKAIVEPPLLSTLDVIALMLRLGADPGLASGGRGLNPIMLACEHGAASLVDLLLAAITESEQLVSTVNACNIYDSTALMMAAWGMDSCRGECVELLLHAGADPNIQDSERSTAMLEACIKGDPRPIELLLHYGADLNHEDKNMRSPFTLVSGYGKKAALEVLLLATGLGPSKTITSEIPEHTQRKIRSALYQAIYWRNDAIVTRLLEAGALQNKTQRSDVVARCNRDQEDVLSRAERWCRRRAFATFRANFIDCCDAVDTRCALDGTTGQLWSAAMVTFFGDLGMSTHLVKFL
jgi:hypothetical protein